MIDIESQSSGNDHILDDIVLRVRVEVADEIRARIAEHGQVIFKVTIGTERVADPPQWVTVIEFSDTHPYANFRIP